MHQRDIPMSIWKCTSSITN
uniref:Uncharacterized protein n=1 Tax=Rhizophora mucronata TaxID=61149 RepID=A0A2P2N1Y8_RHIMU